ncbi:MAG: hypothetical protein D6806_08550, partial [Deltaproteobacteria bacterium]
MPRRKPLGQILLDEGVIDEFQLKAALGHQKRWGGKLGKVLVENRFITEQALVEALHNQTGVPIVDLDNLEIPSYLIRTVPLQLAMRHNMVPVKLEGEPGKPGETLYIAMSDPTNLEALDEVRFRSGKRTAPLLATDSAIKRAIERCYTGTKTTSDAAAKGRPLDSAESAGEGKPLKVVTGRLESPPPAMSKTFGSVQSQASTPVSQLVEDPFAELESLALDEGAPGVEGASVPAPASGSQAVAGKPAAVAEATKSGQAPEEEVIPEVELVEEVVEPAQLWQNAADAGLSDELRVSNGVAPAAAGEQHQQAVTAKSDPERQPEHLESPGVLPQAPAAGSGDGGARMPVAVGADPGAGKDLALNGRAADGKDGERGPAGDGQVAAKPFAPQSEVKSPAERPAAETGLSMDQILRSVGLAENREQGQS